MLLEVDSNGPGVSFLKLWPFTYDRDVVPQALASLLLVLDPSKMLTSSKTHEVPPASISKLKKSILILELPGALTVQVQFPWRTLLG